MKLTKGMVFKLASNFASQLGFDTVVIKTVHSDNTISFSPPDQDDKMFRVYIDFFKMQHCMDNCCPICFKKHDKKTKLKNKVYDGKSVIKICDACFNNRVEIYWCDVCHQWHTKTVPIFDSRGFITLRTCPACSGMFPSCSTCGKKHGDRSTCFFCSTFVTVCACCGIKIPEQQVNTKYIDFYERFVCTECHQKYFRMDKQIKEYSYKPQIVMFETPYDREAKNKKTFLDFASKFSSSFVEVRGKKMPYKEFVRTVAAPRYAALYVDRVFNG